MGCSQVVRQRTLTPLFVGSSPTTPDFIAVFSISTYRKNGSYNKLHLTFRHFFCTLLFSRIRLELGLVAQWTRARGYEPRCQGFESLLARLKCKFNRKRLIVNCLTIISISANIVFEERWQSWSIASDLKSDEVQASVGSNPTFSDNFFYYAVTEQ